MESVIADSACPYSEVSGAGGFVGGKVPLPRGKVLGGSNEFNFMLHVRGTPGDYNGWAKVVGDERWNASSMASMEDRYEEKISRITPEPHDYVQGILAVHDYTASQ